MKAAGKQRESKQGGRGRVGLGGKAGAPRETAGEGPGRQGAARGAARTSPKACWWQEVARWRRRRKRERERDRDREKERDTDTHQSIRSTPPSTLGATCMHIYIYIHTYMYICVYIYIYIFIY